MMGDQDTSYTTYPPFQTPRRDEFEEQAPTTFVSGTTAPPFANHLHFLPSPLSQPLVHPSAVPFRQDAPEEWSNRAFQQPASGPLIGPSHWSEAQIPGRSCHSEDTLDLMTGSGVGADDLLTFPRGEDGAVSITARDLDGLEPTKFLRDNVIDFYMKYLNSTLLSSQNQKRFHFFNSFFFRKLLDNTASTDIDPCKVDYQPLRRWTGEVNLFEKDYIFIPVIKSSHWSLIVICHLSSLNPSIPDKKKGSPCMLQLDPIAGQHESFEGQIRSYILQAWMERFQGSNNMDLLHSLFQMKYFQAEVPKQDNGYDCGLYVLHYIEVFVPKATSPHFNFSSSEPGAHFTSLDFKSEALDKRMRIKHLILELGGTSQEQVGKCLDIETKPRQRGSSLRHLGRNRKCLPRPPKPLKEIKSKKWKGQETSDLLRCMVVGGRFCKGKQGAMHWDLICEEINKKNNNGPTRSKEQCQNRFDTLLKAYKDLNAYCVKTGKKFSEVTNEEKRDLKLATPLEERKEEWYNHLDIIYRRRLRLRGKAHKRAKAQKRPKLNPGADTGNGPSSSSPRNSSPRSPAASSPTEEWASESEDRSLKQVVSPAASSPTEEWASESEERSLKQVAIPGFKTLNEELRSTLLNLIQACSIRDWWEWDIGWHTGREDIMCNLKVVCRRLAIVQDQKLLDIYRYILKLWELKLVKMRDWDSHDEESDHDVALVGGWMERKWLFYSHLEAYKKFAKKVLSKNPHLTTFHKRSHENQFATKLFPLQQIRVLSLYERQEVEHVDLRDFPGLRYLSIKQCSKVKRITGWEVVKELGWIKISYCHSFCDVSNVEWPSSLREFSHSHGFESRTHWQLASFSQCVRLHRLEILDDRYLPETMDLKALKFLEVLRFASCSTLSTIHGLSELQGLTKLSFTKCESLKRVPELGCMKALTHLDMSWSGVMEISGVEELHLLTKLDLFGCISLERLPSLGQLKVLVFLDISYSGIKEIPGVEDLVSLERLFCEESKLERLPDLYCLSRLKYVEVQNTPMTTSDPSSSFNGKQWLYDNRKEEKKVFMDDISDISDTEYKSSDEE